MRFSFQDATRSVIGEQEIDKELAPFKIKFLKAADRFVFVQIILENFISIKLTPENGKN